MKKLHGLLFQQYHYDDVRQRQKTEVIVTVVLNRLERLLFYKLRYQHGNLKYFSPFLIMYISISFNWCEKGIDPTIFLRRRSICHLGLLK